MMRQYLELKSQVPDALLLYRMGDFYELFFEDARTAARLLELTLTSRNKNDPDPIPMAGVPHHALENYLRRLVDAGQKVAIAEQRGEPGGAKILTRELVRVVTPGLPWSPDEVEARESCWLAGLSGSGPVGLALLDVSTGEVRLTELPGFDEARTELARLEVREVLVDPRLADGPQLDPAMVASKADDLGFDAQQGHAVLCRVLGTQDLSGFGADGLGPALAAADAVISYAREKARVDLANVRRLRVYQSAGHMCLDPATRKNLELTRPLHGTGRKGTLLGLLDRTCTPMGGRLLREWIAAPLVHAVGIDQRLDAVEVLTQPSWRQSVRARLKLVADIERLASKAAQGTASARDLTALADSLRTVPGITETLHGAAALRPGLPTDAAADVCADIEHWVVDNPPAALTEGGLLREGVHERLDELRALAREGKGAIARIEAREKAATGISSLKIKHNRVFGYFLEVTHANRDRVPDKWIRKQTLTNAERYITPELKEFEETVLGADEKRKALELELFRSLRSRVAAHQTRLQALAGKLAWLDVVAALADLAVDRRYVRPTLADKAHLEIVGGRHPVVEATRTDEQFVPNDLALGPGRRLAILTGPNMAGKSTVMRQVALIVLMAQIGSFVPAERAEIGLVDRVFVRVGASDDLAHGRSTFMVEMSETAHILHQATPRSLILLDEIGRGTSTYDGMAIAWAVAEAVHDQVGARAIFATHYHELVALADERPDVVNLHVAVSEWGERIIFLRKLELGGASKSYGIQCARLAGMPETVVARAKELLAELEKRPRHGPPTQQLALFHHSPPAPSSAVEDALASIEPDSLSPREALDLVYRLKELLP